MAKLELPSDPKLAGRLVQSHVDTEDKRMRRGALGAFFGMEKEKPQNAAIFAFCVSAAMFIVVYFVGPESPEKSTVLGVIGSVFTGSIGYLFGGAGRA